MTTFWIEMQRQWNNIPENVMLNLLQVDCEHHPK